MCNEERQILPKMHSFASGSKGELCIWITIHKKFPYLPFGREVGPCRRETKLYPRKIIHFYTEMIFVSLKHWFVIKVNETSSSSYIHNSMPICCVVPMHIFCFIYHEYCTILWKTLLLSELPYSCGKKWEWRKEQKMCKMSLLI